MSKINLSPTQKKIVEWGDGALLVVAGPGSGKTRVLTERIRNLLNTSTDRFRILALTFTNKAANEMRERLAEFPEIEEKAFLGTMHSFCLDVLASRGQPVGVDGNPHIFELYQDKKQVLAHAVAEEPELQAILQEAGGPKEQDKLLGRWLEMISSAKSRLQLPEMLNDNIEAKVYACYDQGLRASKAYDFDDLLLLAYRLFTERPKIADFYRRQYQYMFIDESQDINEAQYRVLQALCGTEYRNVMMVGDPKQAIFMWNGANPKYLDMFEREFKATKIELKENFRSSKAIVQAAKGLIPTYHVDGQLPIPGELELFVGDDEADEARQVVEKITRLKKDGHKDVEGAVDFGRMALIGRNRYVFAAVEKLLAEKNIPFYKKLSTQNESESDLIQDLELCLRLVANPNDRLHLGSLLKRWGVPANGDSWTERRQLLQGLRKLTTDAAHLAVLKAIGLATDDSDNLKLLAALDHLTSYAEKNLSEAERVLVAQDIQVWRTHWEMYIRSQPGHSHPAGTFLSHVALGTTQQPKSDGIALLTIHSAKGLEFDVVFLMGLMEGTFPDYRAKGPSMEEETRNAFVAVTRSKRLLYLSYPKVKETPWGQKSQSASRFIKSVGLVTEG